MSILIALEITIGILLLIFGTWLWLDPNVLSRESWLYSYWLIDWKIGPRKKTDIDKLNNKQIRYYCLRMIGGGIFLIILGIVSLY
jgi:hypothetical protein